MQIVEIDLIDGFPFYCPITGAQILSEEEFNPSPAMVYCIVQGESAFEFINDEAKAVFGEALKGGAHLDYEEYDKILFSLKDDDVAKNWICFRLCSGTNFSGYVVDHCIDMSYRP